ncbi:hypothetical protein [Nostoc sp. NMS9]|uniref:hypothetical protein n=1 Tax=Nostoc sp. NMS9 TaxID=2815393 RepID=UPI0025DE52CD|nr:hypothetical protein [Nostoc sp. NMS9]MBN3938451.1 hypothetical protein [Nostoc sp. NMS9]
MGRTPSLRVKAITGPLYRYQATDLGSLSTNPNGAVNAASINDFGHILGWIGLMVAFGMTVPIAILRVSANPKFANQPLNSQTCDSRNQKPEQLHFGSRLAAR